MRYWLILTMLVFSQTTFNDAVRAADPWPPGPAPIQAPTASECDGHVAGCRCLGCRLRGCLSVATGKNVEGKDLSFSCQAQGSYKFPVPPLYTYHWPGMYSQPLMTDYHSPWRYPPLKPYTEDTKTIPSKTTGNTARLQRPNF